MKCHDSLSSGKISLPLISILTCATTIACGPKAAPATTDAATASTSTTAPGTSTSTSTGTTGDASTTPTTTDPSTSSTTCNTSDCSGSSAVACSFLGCPDDTPHRGQCDVFAQDCPEGQKCAAWAEDGDTYWNALHCVDVTGDGLPGAPCKYDGVNVGSDDCAKGSMCWHTDENNVGTCVQQCTGTADAPICPNGPCTISGDGALILCLSNCNPLLQDCPNAGLCIPNGDSFVCS